MSRQKPGNPFAFTQGEVMIVPEGHPISGLMPRETKRQPYFSRRYDPRVGAYSRMDQAAIIRYHHDVAANLLRNSLCDVAPARIIDIGCASGAFTARLKGLYPDAHVVGVDFVEEGLVLARNRYRDIEFVNEGLPQLSFQSRSADVICCMDVLYYLNREDLELTIAQLDRVLSDQGVIVVSTNLDDGRRYFTESEILRVFGSRFEILAYAHEYCRIYKLVNLPLQLARRVIVRMSQGLVARKLLFVVDYILGSDVVVSTCIGIGKNMLGSRAITKGCYVFKRKVSPG